MKTGLYLWIALALVLSACSPFTLASSAGEQPTAAEEYDLAPTAQTAGPACSEPVEVPVVDGRVEYNGISFHLDPSLASAVAVQTCPAVALAMDQAPGDAHPPYTQFSFPSFERKNVDYQPEIRVYEIQGDLQDFLFPINELDELRAVLEQRPEPVTWFQHSPLHTHQAYLDFANGSGARGLVQYMQDYFFYTNNGLIYEFHGLTQDGRHFVSVRHPISVPFLMELEGISLPPDNINPQAIAIQEWPAEYEDQRRVIESYNNEALQRFEQMSDAEASPDIALLDGLVQSIQVGRP